MKYAIVIPDGAADETQEALSVRTPLQAARAPYMDRIARTGRVGETNNVPPPLTPASDVATLSLFGYDPLQVYTGRAPLEAAAMGIALGPDDWAIRCNLVTIENGEMRDFTAGHIAGDVGRALVQALHEALGGRYETGQPKRHVADLEFCAGVSYRNILVWRAVERAPFTDQTRTQPPHDIPDRPVAAHLPQGPGAAILTALMERSRPVVAGHPLNPVREGRPQATQIWLWGLGRAPHLTPFSELHGKRGAIISAVDLVRGVGTLIGWTRIDVPGATGYLDTDYAAKGRAAVAALAGHDIVCVHVEAPDEASHEGRTHAKVGALESIDREIVGPLLDALPRYGEWRILISPDHRTPLRTRAHAHGPVPFATAGTGITPGDAPGYDEEAARAGGLSFARGCDLMPWFLGEAKRPSRLSAATRGG